MGSRKKFQFFANTEYLIREYKLAKGHQNISSGSRSVERRPGTTTLDDEEVKAILIELGEDRSPEGGGSSQGGGYDADSEGGGSS